MILRTESIKEVCSKILTAVDNGSGSDIYSETLQIEVFGGQLYISVTNKEYFTRVKLDVDTTETLNATVNASLFLKLVAQITTETIELKTSDTSLIVKGNGVYKIPLIYDEGALLELPEIKIENVTKEMDIPSDILLSILQYNSKELNKGTVFRPVQKLFYVDELGAITFTSGACVNSFSLPEPVKVLLSAKLVKLFKLFKEGNVHFTLGFDPIKTNEFGNQVSNTVYQTKVKFETKDIELTSILTCDDALIGSVPVAAIRGRAESNYPYSINVSKDSLIQAINRLLLFGAGKKLYKPYSEFEFGKDEVVIYDNEKENKEILSYTNTELALDDTYKAVLDLNDLKITLESCNEQYLTINFGDGEAVLLSRGNVKNVIPEIRYN